MIACFQYGIEHIVIDNPMSSPCAFANIDARTRHIVDGVMDYKDMAAHGQLHACHLLLKQTDVMYQIVRKDTLPSSVRA